ncbi:hypothetical protein [Tersicoccus sp. Bi-70]|uniref:hypothetical protein n=1 Tax=Tersicoccus sp. Bi-70 TaxID=1897634 RepID=UPI000978C894|nr:hypothetical protein [Tersicoccus sp. Bi-70]OMH30619.1 hypothetical protein BGP79_11715 [Tersicoccus sp. Bi-70]
MKPFLADAPMRGVDVDPILPAELRPRQERLLEAILTEQRSLVRQWLLLTQREGNSRSNPQIDGHADQLDVEESAAGSDRSGDLAMKRFLEGVRQVAEQFAAVVQANGHGSSSPVGGAPASAGAGFSTPEPMGEDAGAGTTPTVSQPDGAADGSPTGSAASDGSRGGDETSSPRVHVHWTGQLGPASMHFDKAVLVNAIEEQWRRDGDQRSLYR